MAIDTHMHINSLLIPKYYSSIEGAIKEVNEDDNLSHVINVGLDLDTSKECTIISTNNSKFYNSVGIHPLYIEKGQDPKESSKIISSLIDDKTVAIGEIGLDSIKSNFEVQKAALIEQIRLANEEGLPVIIHANNSSKDIFHIFDTNISPEHGCVFHCFQPEFSSLDYMIKHGYYMSFAGRITYNNARRAYDVSQEVPEDLLLVETDSPYISPEPHRSEPGKSSYLSLIIETIALYKGKDFTPKDIEQITTENAKKLFKRLK